MAEVFVCPECGLEANYQSIAGKGGLSVNMSDAVQLCRHLSEAAGDPAECPSFLPEIDKLRR